jgi:hypothetical protein
MESNQNPFEDIFRRIREQQEAESYEESGTGHFLKDAVIGAVEKQMQPIVEYAHMVAEYQQMLESIETLSQIALNLSKQKGLASGAPEVARMNSINRCNQEVFVLMGRVIALREGFNSARRAAEDAQSKPVIISGTSNRSRQTPY